MIVMIMLMGVTKAIFSSIPDVAISIITCVITIVIKTYHNCPYCPISRSSVVVVVVSSLSLMLLLSL